MKIIKNIIINAHKNIHFLVAFYKWSISFKYWSIYPCSITGKPTLSFATEHVSLDSV